MKTVRWGVLSTANIATTKVIPAMQQGVYCEFTAIASRNLEQAQAAEAQQLADVAKQYPHLKVMEAFMYRFHPQWQRARQLVSEGKIGTLRTIHTFFSYYLDDPLNVRNRADSGGGGMLDIGCYTVSVARFIFGSEPRRVFGIVEFDP